MDRIPSKSLPISVMLATPLFLLVLCILMTSNEASYLFVLKFVNQVAGKADITFIPTLQPETDFDTFLRGQVLSASGITREPQAKQRLPFVNVSELNEWRDRNKEIISGVSGRWLIPVQLSKNDGLLLVLDVQNQLKIKVTNGLSPLANDQVALSQELTQRLNLKPGDKLPLKLSIKTMLNGAKLQEKYQSFESREEAVVDTEDTNLTVVAGYLHAVLIKNNVTSINQSTIQRYLYKFYDYSYTQTFKVAYAFKNDGIHASVLHNVLIIGNEAFADILTSMVIQGLIEDNQLQAELIDYTKKNMNASQALFIERYLKLQRISRVYEQPVRDSISSFLSSYSLLAVTTFAHPELIYNPSRVLYRQMTEALESAPTSSDPISIYPLYEIMESIRFVFQSIIITFIFITGMLYFYIMSLTFKKIFEQKSIEVGIWRTLGAGGTSKQNGTVAKLYSFAYIKQQLIHFKTIMVSVGFIREWSIVTFASVLLYSILQQYLLVSVCSALNFLPIRIEPLEAIALFFGVLLFLSCMSMAHIYHLYTEPLVSTIKPFKRTFDIVKIRVLKLATFGVSTPLMITALVMIYYGVIAYYWIPRSVLYEENDLQTFLFDTILVMMICGSIVLAAVLQSHIEIVIHRGLFLISPRLRKIKEIMLKNIKAKSYQNLKVSIVVALLFAFLLFFGAGISSQIAIVRSFIERQLGAELVLENYERKTFDRTEVEAYLNTFPGVKYSWLSKNVNRNGLSIEFLNFVGDSRTPLQRKTNFKIITSNYLKSAYYNYYYPEEYMFDKASYAFLPNGVYDGFSSIYTNGNSVGKYDPADSFLLKDPNSINLKLSTGWDFTSLAPQQQIINIVATNTLRKQLGATAGDIFRLKVSYMDRAYLTRARITHSLKAGPGLDLMVPEAYISEQQADYICRLFDNQTLLSNSSHLSFEKLFISGSDRLSEIGNKIIAMSPQHTQIFQSQIVSENFSVIEEYLRGFVLLITLIISTLAVLFLLIYTKDKCNEEAEMYKTLRAVGMRVSDIRLMVFLDVLVRVVVSITNGLLMGILFSVGVEKQLEEFLMVQTPSLQYRSIMALGVVLLLVFGVTVQQSTRHLSRKTVLQTAD